MPMAIWDVLVVAVCPYDYRGGLRVLSGLVRSAGVCRGYPAAGDDFHVAVCRGNLLAVALV